MFVLCVCSFVCACMCVCLYFRVFGCINISVVCVMFVCYVGVICLLHVFCYVYNKRVLCESCVECEYVVYAV